MAARVFFWRERNAHLKSALLRLKDDPRETPIYSVHEAASYVRVPRSTLRHWLKPTSKARAVIEVADEKDSQLSFYNLLEAHVVKVAVERDAWLHRIRTGVEKLRERAPQSRHPLLEHQLWTAGGYRDIFVKSITGDIENLSKGGQFEFRQLLSRYLSRIDFDASGPYQLRPYRFQHIAINHRVSGGRPVVKGTGILAEIIASRRRAGESIPDLAHDYEITTADVRDAIRYSSAA
jgi:uncharacterized protein (DUF433 family)/DNA-binding transcriptional ArsR family regulator